MAGTTRTLDRWLHDAHHSGVYAMQRFAHTLSNVQTEGQISRLKTLKRAMCGRAGTALLRARILPL